MSTTTANLTAAKTRPSATRGVDADQAKRILPTLNDDGTRRWIKPRPSEGRFRGARRVVAYLLIAIFAALPYFKLNGRPLVLLDLTTRRFSLFGATFLPTDTFLLALLLVGVFLTIFFLTALLGRVWCGWACPQTVYMEFVFRPIERLCQGTPGRSSKSWFVRSGAGKIAQPVLFFLVACFLAHVFLSYFVGIDKLSVWIRQSPLEHPTPFLVMAVVTGLMLFDFGFFREQTCLVACPYGRFQSALLDRQSLIIGYDTARGEPRGKGKKSVEASIPLPVLNGAGDTPRTGDCVDCGLCVVTCPTGIDIRNGLQMECIGCAQCIDACDSVMTKLNRPRGLIRYSSQARLAGEKSHLLRVRTVLYPTLILLVASLFVVVLVGRAPANVTVLRGLGRPFTVLADGSVENNIRIKIINRMETPQRYQLSVRDPRSAAKLVSEENPAELKSGESRTIPAFITVPLSAFARGSFDVEVLVDDGHGYQATIRYRLQGPAGGPNAAEGAHP